MGIFGSGKNKEKIVAIFDIGSGSVGGALVRIFPKMKDGGQRHPIIISQARTDITFQDELDFERFFTDMQKALLSTANEIYHAKVGAPSEIICVLASPWYVGETRQLHYEKKNSFIVTKSIIDEMAKTELENLAETYKKKYEEIQGPSTMIESKIFQSHLNGYLCEEPIGKRAKTLDINMFVSISPEICLSRIREGIVKVFHHTPVSFTSFITSIFSGAQERFVDQDAYFLIDIRGELTDIAIVSSNVLISTISFPLGKYGIIRAFREFGMPEDQARSMISLHANNMLDAQTKNDVAPTIEQVQKSWSEMFEKSISLLPRTIAVPSMIFLVTDIDTALWFREVVADGIMIGSGIERKKFTVTSLGGQLFLDICKISDGGCDPFLMIEAISASRIHGEKKNI
jgi:hypothetical protein